MSDNTNNTIGAVGGVAAGWASYKYLPTIVRRPYTRWFISECKQIPQSEHNMYWNAAQKAFETSGLKEKGVELIDINSGNLEGVIKDTFEKSDKNFEKITKKIYEDLNIPAPKNMKPKTAPKPRAKWKYILFGPSKDDKLKNVLKSISEGENACFYGMSNNVYVNKDKMGFSVFHEMGHAVNANTTKGLKALAYGRHFAALLAPLLLVTALVKKRKPEYDFESKSDKRKKNFLKDNIGLITFGLLTPTLAEEGLASINGAKLAKNVLSKTELKKLNITNAKAWSTYLVGAIMLSAAAQFAVNIKDKLTQPKQQS